MYLITRFYKCEMLHNDITVLLRKTLLDLSYVMVKFVAFVVVSVSVYEKVIDWMLIFAHLEGSFFIVVFSLHTCIISKLSNGISWTKV